MHDPMVVAFDIRRPWPEIHKLRKGDPRASWRGRRGSFVFVAGRELWWPPIVTVWHVEPGGADALTVCDSRGRWQWHVHHWRIQVQPLQRLRRVLLTRCAYCGGRSTKAAPVNTAMGWHTERAPWWRGERGLYHAACSEPQRQINIRDTKIAQAKSALRMAAKRAENEVVVEGSYFQRDDLPRILGNYMRAAGGYARDAKQNAAALEQVREQRDALREQARALLRELAKVKRERDVALRELGESRARYGDLEARLQPIADAAAAWADAIESPTNAWADDEDLALIAAVDAARQGPPPVECAICGAPATYRLGMPTPAWCAAHGPHPTETGLTGGTHHG